MFCYYKMVSELSLTEEENFERGIIRSLHKKKAVSETTGFRFAKLFEVIEHNVCRRTYGRMALFSIAVNQTVVPGEAVHPGTCWLGAEQHKGRELQVRGRFFLEADALLTTGRELRDPRLHASEATSRHSRCCYPQAVVLTFSNLRTFICSKIGVGWLKVVPDPSPNASCPSRLTQTKNTQHTRWNKAQSSSEEVR